MRDPLTITAVRWQHVGPIDRHAPIFVATPLHGCVDVSDLARYDVQVDDVRWHTGADLLVAAITISDPVDLQFTIHWRRGVVGMQDALLEAWRRHELRLQIGKNTHVVVLNNVHGPIVDLRTARPA